MGQDEFTRTSASNHFTQSSREPAEPPNMRYRCSEFARQSCQRFSLARFVQTAQIEISVTCAFSAACGTPNPSSSATPSHQAKALVWQMNLVLAKLSHRDSPLQATPAALPAIHSSSLEPVRAVSHSVSRAGPFFLTRFVYSTAHGRRQSRPDNRTIAPELCGPHRGCHMGFSQSVRGKSPE
jgi:hypothetical protein